MRKDAWTLEEDKEIIRLNCIYGNKWSAIAKFLPGRTYNSIKNRFNSNLARKLTLEPFRTIREKVLSPETYKAKQERYNDFDLEAVTGLLGDFANAIGLRKRDVKSEAKKASSRRNTVHNSEAISEKSFSNLSQTSKPKTPV